ncbi:MAG TPA: cbb3-type cytochrome c oxidase subunit I [Thermodesulfobacteriota bacterium]|nr:cbb3-type cytochrome c oxidase subunit I [Thermodesulfobacteriota bacterium]
MFELARRYIKTGFVFFIAGLLLGLYIIVNKYVFGSWPPPLLITAHVHVLLFGFIISLIMGVAIWMFPRPRDEQHYSPGLAEVNYWFLTLGTAVRFISEVVSSYMTIKVLVWLIVLGSIFQVISGFLFIYNMWSRVRPVGKQT